MNAEPQWTERADKRGLDPLGLQNAGVSLYQSLLPGISNVTLRMRYFGFFCWVSHAYARTGATNEFAAWQSWVRRAEALYALVCAHARGQVGVGGIDWAVRRLNLGEEVIDFTEAASTTAEEKYLDQALGVFGAAYYSQMVEMGLFVLGDHGIQRATKVEGKAAADAFATSIGEQVEQLLQHSIITSQVSRDDLSRLAVIIPSRIPATSSEQKVYEAHLFPASASTAGDANRSASLRLVLKAAKAFKKRPEPNGIRWHLFNQPAFDDEKLEGQRLRWEAYHCQDLFQIAAASLLEWAVDLTIDPGRTHAEIKEEVRSELIAMNPEAAAKGWSEFLSTFDPDGFDYPRAWSELIGRKDTAGKKAWRTIQLIAALDNRIRAKDRLQEVVLRDLMVRGGARSIVKELEWIGQRSDRRVAELMGSYVVERVVLRHTWVAVQKLRRQGDYTFLFEMNDGRLIKRASYGPAPTTPRLTPAVQFLVDIGLIDEDGPTAQGNAVLEAAS